MTTYRDRLGRAQACGNLIASPRDPLCSAYWRWCNRQRRPFVRVQVGRRYAAGFVDYDSTECLSADPMIGLHGQRLSATGAAAIKAWWCDRGGPHARLLNVYAGAVAIVIDRVPASLAAELGELLSQAATLDDTSDAWVLGVTHLGRLAA